MEVPLRHINGRIFPFESADKLTIMSNRIQDVMYFSVFFAEVSDIKLLLSDFVILIWKSASICRTFLLKSFIYSLCFIYFYFSCPSVRIRRTGITGMIFKVISVSLSMISILIR